MIWAVSCVVDASGGVVMGFEFCSGMRQKEREGIAMWYTSILTVCIWIMIKETLSVIDWVFFRKYVSQWPSFNLVKKTVAITNAISIVSSKLTGGSKLKTRPAWKTLLAINWHVTFLDSCYLFISPGFASLKSYHPLSFSSVIRQELALVQLGIIMRGPSRRRQYLNCPKHSASLVYRLPPMR